VPLYNTQTIRASAAKIIMAINMYLVVIGENSW
jgi:hypothetical protein